MIFFKGRTKTECGHVWTKWGTLIPTYNTGHKQQWRECVTCGLADFRTLEWDHQSEVSKANESLEHARKAQP